MSNLYNKDSIESLSPREHVQLRPGMYIGDTSDPTHLAIEILGNAIDEFNIGHGDKIKINIDKRGNVLIEDWGQGFVINALRDDGETVLQASFDVMNTSGKYRDDGIYEGTAIGLNGIGSKATCFLSEQLIVTSENKKGESEQLTFLDGILEKRNVDFHLLGHQGTCVSFLPSDRFFTSPIVDIKKLKDFCEDITCLCPGLTILFNDEKLVHQNGIKDLLTTHLNKEIEIINNPLVIQEKKDKQSISLAMSYTARSSSNIIAYVNCGLTSAGPHITSIKSTITRVLNKWAKEQNILKTKDKNLDGASLQEGMVLVVNITAEGVAYDAQVKSTITKIDTSFISSVLGEQLEIWLDNNVNDGKTIIEKALVARKASEAAKKARERVKAKAASPTKKKMMDMPSKLADCYEKDRSLCELYLTEGDSASGGCKTIRNSATQAILGLRGKVLNTMTSTPESWHKNQEIMNIVQALGFSWSSDGKSVIYDEQKLRYDKLIIAADRDPDGSHIQSLILTMVWTLFPDLLINGHVYVALPPLYKAEWGTKYQYLDNKKALEEFKKQHTGKFTLTYFKGLGEASAQELGVMIMDPATRNIQKVEVDDIGIFDKIINNLMGKSSVPKKEFIFNRAVKEVL